MSDFKLRFYNSKFGWKTQKLSHLNKMPTRCFFVAPRYIILYHKTFKFLLIKRARFLEFPATFCHLRQIVNLDKALGSTVVENTTHNLKIKGSNPRWHKGEGTPSLNANYF